MMNNKHDVLYLGSQSRGRQELLQAAKIPFCVVDHTSTERDVLYEGDSNAYVIAVAQDKMDRLLLPASHEINGDFLFVLTAETMIQVIESGELFGKPENHADALAMLDAMYEHQVRVVTGCCLEKRERVDGRRPTEVPGRVAANRMSRAVRG